MNRSAGLGLAAAFGIVKNHNGFIDVESPPDQGPALNIYLPATEKALPSEVQSSPPPKGGSEKPLVISKKKRVKSTVDS